MFIMLGRSIVRRGLDVVPLERYLPLVERSLGMRCRICQDPQILVLLSRARAAVLCAARATEEVIGWRRKSTNNLLSQALKFYGYKEEITRAVLLGGISPLLLEQSSTLADKYGIGGFVELLHIGLSTLLFILQEEPDAQCSTRVMALHSLLSLLLGSHPATVRHGGKVMMALVIAIGRAAEKVEGWKVGKKCSRVEEVDLSAEASSYNEANHISQYRTELMFAQHVASWALVLCGKQSEQVLDFVEKSCSVFLHKYCIAIRNKALLLRDRLLE
uniref:Uncharacterized protein n=1 Tax=Corethron hystrix TaxID=216773 RepID=A0A7S1BNH0_9STRA